MLSRPKVSSVFADSQAPRFLISMLIFGTATGLFMGVLNNYLHEVLTIGRAERGMVELPRELPGLLLVGIIALLYRFSETKILRVGYLVSFAGVVGILFTGQHRSTAIIMIVLWSMGEHILMPLRESLAIHMAHPAKQGLAMGSVRSMGNTGMVVGYYLIPAIFFLFPFWTPARGTFAWFRITFVLAAAVLAVGLFITMGIKEHGRHVKRERLYFRRKYTKYYILEVFFGARKQVFLTFAPYVLIMKYNAPADFLALLYGIASTLNIFIGPAVGRLIDIIGYRTVIIVDTIMLVLLCIGYGFTHHVLPEAAAYGVISAIFVLDSILFVVGIARSMYVKSISDTTEEVTATLSTGISINHLVSILIAVGGGFLWEALGMETLFSVAALSGVGSFFFSLTLPKTTTCGNRP